MGCRNLALRQVPTGQPCKGAARGAQEPKKGHRALPRHFPCQITTGLYGPTRGSCGVDDNMSSKPSAKQPLSATIKEHWGDQLELGGSKSGYVACYAANQVLGTIWRGDQETPDAKEIRNTATLGRLSDIGSRDV